MIPQIIKGWNYNTINWDDCIDIYNSSIEECKNKPNIIYDSKSQLLLYGNMVKMALPGFFNTHNAHIHQKVQDAMKMTNTANAHLYFNISRKPGSLGLHYDEEDVFYWQCVGKVVVIIDDVEYLLNPGDMIKIPKYVKHNVVPITPRIGISMSVT